MKMVSYAQATRDLAALLELAKDGDVVIQAGDEVVGALVSPSEYKRIHAAELAELQALCERASAEAAANGMTDAVLDELLADED